MLDKTSEEDYLNEGKIFPGKVISVKQD